MRTVADRYANLARDLANCEKQYLDLGLAYYTLPAWLRQEMLNHDYHGIFGMFHIVDNHDTNLVDLLWSTRDLKQEIRMSLRMNDEQSAMVMIGIADKLIANMANSLTNATTMINAHQFMADPLELDYGLPTSPEQQPQNYAQLWDWVMHLPEVRVAVNLFATEQEAFDMTIQDEDRFLDDKSNDGPRAPHSSSSLQMPSLADESGYDAGDDEHVHLALW